jgi:hypothetical protein
MRVMLLHKLAEDIPEDYVSPQKLIAMNTPRSSVSHHLETRNSWVMLCRPHG